ncbi:uncharacterized protein BDR25DRAFT_252611, partial [Lindgomyces ingoldianus]
MGEKQTIALASCAFLLGLSLVFVAARIYVRCRMLRNAGKDDLLCVLAAALSIVETVFMFFEVKYGSGKRRSQLSSVELEKQRFTVFMSIMPYLIGLMFVKMSIIYQMRRFFSSFYSPTLSFICHLVLVLIIATTIAHLCVSILQCRPIQGFWRGSLNAKCLDLARINYAYLAVNAFTDLVLLVLPMPTLYRLRLRKAEKRAVVGIFALGGFAALTSILRIPYVLLMDRGGDPVYHGFGILVWTRVELGVSIICACLPCLRAPLAQRFPHIWGSVSRSSSDCSGPSFFRSRNRESMKGLSRLDSNRKSYANNGPATYYARFDDDLETEDCEMKKILSQPIAQPEDPEPEIVKLTAPQPYPFNQLQAEMKSRRSEDNNNGLNSLDQKITVTTVTQQRISHHEPGSVIQKPRGVLARAWSERKNERQK